MKNIFAYSLKVWLFAVILGTIITYGIFCYELTQTLIWRTSTQKVILQETFISAIFMIVFSIPVYIFYFLINRFFHKNEKSLLDFKIKINIFGVLLISFPLLFLGSSFELEFLLFPVFLTIGIWIFSIKENPSNLEILDDIDFEN